MKPVDDDLNRVRDIETMTDFRAALRQRRFQAGFDKLPQLLRSIKGARFSLPSSTAYDLCDSADDSVEVVASPTFPVR